MYNTIVKPEYTPLIKGVEIFNPTNPTEIPSEIDKYFNPHGYPSRPTDLSNFYVLMSNDPDEKEVNHSALDEVIGAIIETIANGDRWN